MNAPTPPAADPTETTPADPAAFAARIVLEGALPAVIAPQAIQGQLPAAPRTLAAHERIAVGMEKPGVTLAYPTSGPEVFLDLGGPHATVWFQGRDAYAAIDALTTGLAARFPQAELLGEEENPGDPALRVRHWRVRAADGVMVADLRATFPAANIALAQRALFLVRIFAQRQGQTH